MEYIGSILGTTRSQANVLLLGGGQWKEGRGSEKLMTSPTFPQLRVQAYPPSASESKIPSSNESQTTASNPRF